MDFKIRLLFFLKYLFLNSKTFYHWQIMCNIYIIFGKFVYVIKIKILIIIKIDFANQFILIKENKMLIFILKQLGIRN